MATRTKTGLLLPLVLVTGAVAYFGSSEVTDTLGSLFSSDPVIVGAGDVQVMVAGGAESRVEQCTAEQVLKEKRCGDVKVIILSAAKMPYITRNISLAWSEGRDFILTKDGKNRAANYNRTCRKTFVKKYNDGSCDEYEFASSVQGGKGARTEEVPAREQACQGGTLSTSYRYQGINDGDDFLVVISDPGKIASAPYQGQDVAEDKTSCGN
ncbi:MAG: NucA/NucB deoxyribonuclease domain-containing protein [Actinomycetota bacterium]|nr:NucA/NucB deoxyribonuclease domain-containing protein [Actinomycetota bacterium]